MPYLNEIIGRFNSELKANSLTDARFAGGLFGGIAYQVTRETTDGDQIFPALFNNGEVERYIGVDDTFPLIVYHRVLNNSYSQDTKYTDTYVSTTNMVMVVYAKRSKVNLTPDQVEAMIVGGFPQFIKTGTLEAMGLDGMMNVQFIPGTTTLNPLEVFAGEYKNVAYRLGADEVLFSIRYTILTTFNKDCLTNCCDSVPLSELCLLINQSTATEINECLSETQIEALKDLFDCGEVASCNTTYNVNVGGVLRATGTIDCSVNNTLNIYPS